MTDREGDDEKVDKRMIWLFGGAAVVLAGIIAASLFHGAGRSPGRENTEQTRKETSTERKENIRHDGMGSDMDDRQTKEELIDLNGPGDLYYLDPEGDQAFQERLTRFLRDKGIEAERASVLEIHIDDRTDEKTPALFYLQLDDDAATIVEVSFEKTSGRYAFALCEGKATIQGRIAPGEGKTEYAIPESTDDEKIPKVPVTVTDPEEELTENADMDQLEEALTAFLYSIDESRRDFYVSSFGLTEKGWEAVLEFSTVRHDGRNVEVKYDGTYHFRLA